MPSTRTTIAGVLALILAACERAPTSPTSVGSPRGLEFSTASSSNPTASWEFPLNDAALSVRSDHRFQESTGTYSVYANAVCGVSSTLFFSGSGDNTISFNYPKTNQCGRTWTVTYPDSFVETLAYQGGVQILENSSYQIPIDAVVKRHFRFGTGRNGNPSTARCGQGLVFGPNGANPAPGSDSVLVHRVDASTWDVYSQPAPNDFAYCIDNGKIYEMQMSFRIVSSQPLP